MDMNVNLNLSYPSLAPQGAVAPVVVDKDKSKVEAVAPTPDKAKPGDLEKAVTDIKEFVQAASAIWIFPLMIPLTGSWSRSLPPTPVK